MNATIALSLLLMTLPSGSPKAYSPSEDSNPDVVFLPDDRMMTVLTANPEEPRLGLRKEIGTSRMRLDIGGRLDVVELRFSPQQRVRIGFTFFSYALTTSREGLRLQVDAVDGFFGGYLLYGILNDRTSMVARLRILHQSAHFVDGHYDNDANIWIGSTPPIPFTKDFGDLTGLIGWRMGPCSATSYAGISYATLVRPPELPRIAGFLGAEIRSSNETLSLFERPMVIYGAYHLALQGIPTYVVTGTAETGVKFGEWTRSGIRVFLSYRNGLEPFGQYYSSKQSVWELGFGFDV